MEVLVDYYKPPNLRNSETPKLPVAEAINAECVGKELFQVVEVVSIPLRTFSVRTVVAF